MQRLRCYVARMKGFTKKPLVLMALFLVTGTALLLNGCASTKKVNWNSRVGSYTYDQAVAELGSPDKQAKTSSGQTVADWIKRRLGGSSISFGTGFYGRNGGVAVGQSVGSGYQDSVTRLTFDTDGKLISWFENR